MPPAVAVELFSTSILSNHKVRKRHERFLSVLQVKKIPFVYHDLASDDDAKSRWRRIAKDQQLPGLLVHGEWRGTFEEFEESVELGELDLFLRIDQERAKREAEDGTIQQPMVQPQQQEASSSSLSSNQLKSKPAVQPRNPSRHQVVAVPRLAQPRQASMTGLAPALPMAAPRSAERRKVDQDADHFLRSIGLDNLDLSEAELSEVLEAGKSTASNRHQRKASLTEESAERGEGRYPRSLGIGSSSQQKAIPRTYIPSADAGTKPLRLAKMGNGSTNATPLRAESTPHARYNASAQFSQALAAEAQATASSRSFSTMKLRDAVQQGDDLKSAMSSTRMASNTDKAEQVVGREDIDELMASLGLNDVKMSEEEAEAFLFDGVIPSGMGSNGSRLGRAESLGDRARNETAAKNVAQRAREKVVASSSRQASYENQSVVQHALTPETPTIDLPSEKKDDELVEAPVKVEKEEDVNEDPLASKDEPFVKEEDMPIGIEDTPKQRSTDLYEEAKPHELDSIESETPKVASPPLPAKDNFAEKLASPPISPREGKSTQLPSPPASPRNAKLPSPPASPREGKTASPFQSVKGSPTSMQRPSSRLSQPGALELDPSIGAIAEQIQSQETTPQVAGSLLSSPVSISTDDKIQSPKLRINLEDDQGQVKRDSAGSSNLRSPISPKSPTASQIMTPSSSFNRRRGIDVSRANVSSPSPSDRALSPPIRGSSPWNGSKSGSEANLQISRSASQDSSRSLKSPKGEKKRMFSLGRKRSKEKRSSQGEELSEEDIPTTTDPNLLESRSKLPASGYDRSQKTLSVILREADEALSGIDGDGEEEDAAEAADGLGSFDLEIDGQKSYDSAKRSK